MRGYFRRTVLHKDLNSAEASNCNHLHADIEAQTTRNNLTSSKRKYSDQSPPSASTCQGHGWLVTKSSSQHSSASGFVSLQKAVKNSTLDHLTLNEQLPADSANIIFTVNAATISESYCSHTVHTKIIDRKTQVFCDSIATLVSIRPARPCTH